MLRFAASCGHPCCHLAATCTLLTACLLSSLQLVFLVFGTRLLCQLACRCPLSVLSCLLSVLSCLCLCWDYSLHVLRSCWLRFTLSCLASCIASFTFCSRVSYIASYNASCILSWVACSME